MRKEIYYELKNIFDEKNNIKIYTVLESDIKFYCLKDGLNAYTFNTEDELFDFLNIKRFSYFEKYTIEYIGTVYGKKNVIRETKGPANSRLVALKDKKSYYVFNSLTKKWETFYDNMDMILPIYDKINNEIEPVDNEVYMKKKVIC